MDLIKTADFKDIITITDTLTGELIDLSTLEALEVVYFTDPRTQIKFSRDLKTGYITFIQIDSKHYVAYIENLSTLKTGKLMSFIDIDTTNSDLTKGYFTNQGVVDLGINLIDTPLL